jgi:stalled ribosome rescue protein Dom34
VVHCRGRVTAAWCVACVCQLGAYHTLALELNRNFTLDKSCWDVVVLDRLNEACDPTKQVRGRHDELVLDTDSPSG